MNDFGIKLLVQLLLLAEAAAAAVSVGWWWWHHPDATTGLVHDDDSISCCSRKLVCEFCGEFFVKLMRHLLGNRHTRGSARTCKC